MNHNIKLIRVAGIQVSAHWSWLIVFALISWTLASTVFPSQDPHLSKPTYVAMGLVAAIVFFASLLLHELGHAFQARREGVEVEGITLWLFGGVAQLKGMFPSAGAELRIAVAGPAVSALLGGLLVGIGSINALGAVVGGVASWLGYINLLVLAFNLLPALPLDGGRVLHALLWRRSGDFTRATRIAANAGRVFGYLLIGLGMLLFMGQGAWSGAWFVFLGWFLLQAAAAEGRYALLRDALGDLRVRDLMVRQPETVDADLSLAEFMDSVAHLHHFTTYPVTGDGHVVGLLPFASVARVPRARWSDTSVRTSMVPFAEVRTVRDDAPLIEALTVLAPGTLDRALVLSGDQVVGLLSITDVGRLVAAASQRTTRRA